MTPVYLDPAQSVEARVDALLAEMTLEEKVAQLTSIWAYEVLDDLEFSPEKATALLGHGIGQVTRIGGATNLDPPDVARLANQIQRYLRDHTRLGIPALIHEESCSGYMAKGATCFPQTIGIASTWDVDLARRIGAIIRDQMRAVGARQALAPLLDVARDPRWGRVEETFGEDPYLVAQMGIAYVRGLQGEDLSQGVMATGKHFVGYGASEGGMNWAPAHIPERELREVYLFPFEAAVREAGLGAIMPGYHELDGVPCHDNPGLLRETLRGRWGFQGLVVSDYFAVNQLFEYHQVARDKAEAAALAVRAGVDVELPTRDVYGKPLIEAVARGLVSVDEIDELVRRVLTWKFRLGLFDHPFVDEGAAIAVFDNAAQRQVAREAAEKSMVLLKNDGLLPLAPRGTIAVIGPNAHTTRNLVGDYAYPCHIESLLEQSEDNVFQTPLPSGVKHVDEFIPMRTILEAIQHRVGAEAQVVYAKGCDILGGDDAELEEAVALAAKADVAVVVVGDRAGLTDACTTGESRDRASLSLIGRQEELVRRVLATGTKTVVVLVSGRPLAIPDIAERANAVLAAWLPGEEGAEAVAGVLFGDVNPSGKLPITIPRSVGQLPIYYGHKPSGGRSHWKGAYVDESNLPLYPFGHGLSYTEFAYRDLALSPSVMGVHDEVEVSCVIENVGPRAGEEVVQLYGRDVAADVTRPVKALCGFVRVGLAPGEKARVRFRVSAHQFGFYNREMRYVVEPGEIEFMVGGSSEDIRLRGTVRVDGAVTEIEREKVYRSGVDVERM
ncbi:glycoside hydrolase family 3 N-terminal domain-containing protein [Alicyclobacillus sendaiensis]|uniref:Glycoside hydrolase family 3 N-terminal domain-containing protein n=1 Tax=Alicyclobacillus sendaiensis PA2 TaxID=3029425 RepID=A0ABT6XWF3_ALISE|nr:glycoside hydrolase family 3 N-terminal domain-containing protein [Alicyclobacillus sendaiensis]MDI9258964.1 glycoside hydrolase family 3 N-terminal domain-containing protein [Alicyclobacillus sendaiensis PA2]